MTFQTFQFKSVTSLVWKWLTTYKAVISHSFARTIMDTILTFVLHIAHTYNVIIEKFSVCEWLKKIMQTSFDWSRMCIWYVWASFSFEHNMSTNFIAYYWLRTYEPWNKKYSFLSREISFDLKMLESVILSQPWPNFQKMSCKNLSMYPKKYIFYPDRSCDVLWYENSSFWNIKWFLS